MYFNIYVINLKRDIKKWRQIVKHFKNINIDLIRFNAVDGKHLSTHNRWSYDHPTSQWCNYLCTDGMIGWYDWMWIIAYQISGLHYK